MPTTRWLLGSLGVMILGGVFSFSFWQPSAKPDAPSSEMRQLVGIGNQLRAAASDIARPTSLAPRFKNTVGIDLVLIPAGEFWMGISARRLSNSHKPRLRQCNDYR